MTLSTRQRSLLRRAILVICVTSWLAAFAATHVPATTIRGVHVGDKTLHTVGYFFLTGAFLLTLATRGRTRQLRIGLALAVMTAYGAFDELTQELVNRSAEWRDFLADLAGVILAVIVVEAFLWLKARRSATTD